MGMALLQYKWHMPDKIVLYGWLSVNSQGKETEMPRPKKDRNVCSMPRVSAFFPAGESGGCVVLTVEEYECIRLIDHLGFSQEECAAQMQVARTTVQNM